MAGWPGLTNGLYGQFYGSTLVSPSFPSALLTPPPQCALRRSVANWILRPVAVAVAGSVLMNYFVPVEACLLHKVLFASRRSVKSTAVRGVTWCGWDSMQKYDRIDTTYMHPCPWSWRWRQRRRSQIDFVQNSLWYQLNHTSVRSWTISVNVYKHAFLLHFIRPDWLRLTLNAIE